MFAFAITFVTADFQMPNLDNMGNILQTLKDTGMMDQFQEKFSQMFLKPKARTVNDESLHEEDEIDNDPQYDVYEFAKSYNSEKKLDLNEKIMFYLSDLQIADSYHVHTTKLTGILDQIGNISRLKNKNLDGKVMDLVRRVKSLSIMKTSLDRLYQGAATEPRDRKIDTNTDRQTPETEAKTERKTKSKTPGKGLRTNNEINVTEKMKKGLLPENIQLYLESIR